MLKISKIPVCLRKSDEMRDHFRCFLASVHNAPIDWSMGICKNVLLYAVKYPFHNENYSAEEYSQACVKFIKNLTGSTYPIRPPSGSECWVGEAAKQRKELIETMIKLIDRYNFWIKVFSYTMPFKKKSHE